MRVLVNALGAIMGGALRHLTNLLPALSEAPGGHRYDILVRKSAPISSDCDRIRLLRVDDARTESLLQRTFTDLILSAIRARSYDVLVSLMNFGPIVCPIPHVLFQCNALYFSRRYRASIDTLPRMELALRKRWTIESMRFAQTIVTPTNAMANLILEHCPSLRSNRFRTLYHGFDPETLGSNRPEHARITDAPGPKLLYASHLARYKNYEVVLRAHALLKSSYPNMRLFLTFDRHDHAGDFDHYDRIAKKLGIREQIIFLGRIGQKEIGTLYRAADVFLFSSLCESFGFPLLEAMGCGLPIAASDIAVNRELCGKAALYFDPDDEQACARCIRTILEDRSCARSLKENSAYILRAFDWTWRRYAREFVDMVERAALRRAA
jgi:glycosyltransferase involved in cell wall biosynthesis